MAAPSDSTMGALPNVWPDLNKTGASPLSGFCAQPHGFFGASSLRTSEGVANLKLIPGLLKPGSTGVERMRVDPDVANRCGKSIKANWQASDTVLSLDGIRMNGAIAPRSLPPLRDAPYSTHAPLVVLRI